jgi:type I restriction enzyme S subunit
MSWKETSLDKCIDFSNGYAFKSKFFTENKNDIPLIKGENLGKGKVLWEKSKYWKFESLKGLERFLLNAGDIILAMDRPYVGGSLKYAMIKTSDPKALQVQRIGRLVAKQDVINENFLRCVISSDNFKNYVKNIQGGVGVPHISPSQIKNYEFEIPSFQTQKRIAAILSTYNNLIENNGKRIKLLEQAAQNIYKEWFVNMRFSGHENAVVNNDTGLPSGWTKVLAKDYFNFKRGIEVGSKNYVTEASENTIPFLRVGSLGSRDNDIFTDISLVKDKILKFTDVAVSMDGSIGLVGYGLVGAYSTGLRKVIPKSDKYGFGFIYCLLKSEDIQDTIRAYAKGSTILHASSSIDHLNFNNAPSGIANQFNSIIEPIYSQMLNLNKQNQKLKSARDILLPRLMNRTIEV